MNAWQEFKTLVREVIGFNFILWGIKFAPRTPESDALLLEFARFIERTRDHYMRQP